MVLKSIAEQKKTGFITPPGAPCEGQTLGGTQKSKEKKKKSGEGSCRKAHELRGVGRLVWKPRE